MNLYTVFPSRARELGDKQVRCAKNISLLSKSVSSIKFEVDGIMLSGEGKEKCGIMTFYVKQVSADSIKSYLAAHKINVSISKGSGD